MPGTVQLGTNLEIALFDQTRDQLDGDSTLWENLTATPCWGFPARPIR